METKTTQKIDEFVKNVNSMKSEMLGDDSGYVLLAYSEIDEMTQHNSFAVGGKLNNIAECFVSFMKSEPTMANVIIAAANAIVQNRVLEAQILSEARSEDGKKKKNKNKKTN